MGRVSVDIDLSTLPWLQFDWTDNGSYTDNPLQGSAIFGRFRGHDRVIYWSEQR
jgi:MSHA biogenesis protein MshQ